MRALAEHRQLTARPVHAAVGAGEVGQIVECFVALWVHGFDRHVVERRVAEARQRRQYSIHVNAIDAAGTVSPPRSAIESGGRGNGPRRASALPAPAAERVAEEERRRPRPGTVAGRIGPKGRVIRLGNHLRPARLKL